MVYLKKYEHFFNKFVLDLSELSTAQIIETLPYESQQICKVTTGFSHYSTYLTEVEDATQPVVEDRVG